MTDWAPYCDGKTPRKQQIELLNRIEASDAQVVLVQGPTGCGKSLVELAYARHLWKEARGRSHIVTPQKALQDVLGVSPGVAVMKGVRNYSCTAYNAAPLDHSPHSSCPFYRAIDAAQASPIVVHNYASLLWQRRYFEPRKLLCLDEGHRAAEACGSFAEVEFTYDDLSAIGFAGDMRDVTFDDVCHAVIDGEKGEDASEEAKRAFSKLRMFWWLYGLPRPEREDGDDRHVLEGEPVSLDFAAVPGQESVRLVPTRLSPLGHLATRFGEKVLVFSATVLNTNIFCGELGLGKKTIEFIDVPSTFPVENRPVVRRYCGKMTRRDANSTFPKLIRALREDAERHTGEAGLVHTHSHALARQVADTLGNNRVILLPVGNARDATIRDFLSGTFGSDRILVGPGLHEGIDGADDAARWQAIVKSPMPYLGDPRLEAMRSANERAFWSWYAWKTAQTTVQAIGRVVRSAEDRGVTYLYDSCLHDVMTGPYCPGYVKEALRD